MALIEIEQNDPHTLELARNQISQVANAQSDIEQNVCWTMAMGYFLALATHRLIDSATSDQLNTELNQARDAWRAAKKAG